MLKSKITILTLFFASALVLAGCNPEKQNETEAKQTEQTAQLVAEASARTGMPNLTQFAERQLVKYLYEKRDKLQPTYSYLADMNGGLHFLCDSLGYGINASIQYVNSERPLIGNWREQFTTIPQPEPNGLYMPEGLAATYSLCSDGRGGLHALYIEPNLVVSPFPLKYVSDLRVGPMPLGDSLDYIVGPSGTKYTAPTMEPETTAPSAQ